MRITNDMVASGFEGYLTMSIISDLLAVWFIISDPVVRIERFARSVADLGVEARRDMKGEFEKESQSEILLPGVGDKPVSAFPFGNSPKAFHMQDRIPACYMSLLRSLSRLLLLLPLLHH